MIVMADNFTDTLARYLSGKGEYPATVPIRTPAGLIRPKLYSYYDLLTLNEIFFREDYSAKRSDRVIVDIGSNIGISALYFLTQSPTSHCYLFEPDPRNVERLKENLGGFTERVTLSDSAVADQTGIVRFGLDVTSGRYGGINVDFGNFTTVQCLHINQVLSNVLTERPHIDILKIDTEGAEIPTVAAIDEMYLPKIRKIYIEAEPRSELHPNYFTQRQYGTVCQLENKNPPPPSA